MTINEMLKRVQECKRNQINHAMLSNMYKDLCHLYTEMIKEAEKAHTKSCLAE